MKAPLNNKGALSIVAQIIEYNRLLEKTKSLS